MQNSVNQNKQTQMILLQSATSYLFYLGNFLGNGLVTEILLYFVCFCFLTKQQIEAIRFISNKLRFIRCVSLVIVSAVIIHVARHTFATLQIASGTDIFTVSKMLTHKNVSTTQIYAELVNEKKRESANKISLKSFMAQSENSD